MKTKNYCRKVKKGRQAFFMNANGKEYFLFEQDFIISNKEFFKNGYYLTDKVDFSKTKSKAVKNTSSKIPSYIKYIKTKYGIAIYEKTKKRITRQKRKVDIREQQHEWTAV